MYDLEKLSWIIEAKRKRFKILLALYICLVIIGAVMFFIGEMNVVFYGIIIVIIAVALIFKLIRSYGIPSRYSCTNSSGSPSSSKYNIQ